jgi:hypothetical protein
MPGLHRRAVDAVTGRLAVGWADNEGVGTGGTGGVSFTGVTSAQVKVVSGTWGALSAPTRVTQGAGDKVFPAVAIRNGVVAVSYYTRDYVATHNPAVCNWVIPGVGLPGAQIAPSATSVCLDYAARSSRDGYATERRLTSEG